MAYSPIQTQEVAEICDARSSETTQPHRLYFPSRLDQNVLAVDLLDFFSYPLHKFVQVEIYLLFPANNLDSFLTGIHVSIAAQRLPGPIASYFATIDNLDRQADVIKPGAVAESSEKWPIRRLKQYFEDSSQTEAPIIGLSLPADEVPALAVMTLQSRNSSAFLSTIDNARDFLCRVILAQGGSVHTTVALPYESWGLCRPWGGDSVV